MKQLFLDYIPYATRVALVEDGQVIEYSVERTSFRGIVGNIYKGKVKNTVSGMNASFVDIGLPRNGFLQMGESLVDSTGLEVVRTQKNIKVSPGDIIMCQVIKDQFGTKGARLTMDVSIPGNFLVILPNTNYIGISRKIEDLSTRERLENLVKSVAPVNTGFIIRSAAKDAEAEDIINEVKMLENLWVEVQKKYNNAAESTVVFEESALIDRTIRDLSNEGIEEIIVNDEMVKEELRKKMPRIKITYYDGDENIMVHYKLAKQLNHVCDHKVVMENGGSIVIDRTEALTVIDVNSGKYVSDLGLEESVFKTNMAAAEEIAKQVRIRNISGIIIVDFIDMFNDDHKEQVIECLRQSLKKDRLKTTALGMTELGLVEFTRKKTRLPICDYLLQDCEECLTGKRFSDTQIAFMLRDDLYNYLKSSNLKEIYVTIHPDIYKVIQDSNLMSKLVIGAWKNIDINLVIDDTINPSKYLFSDDVPNICQDFIKLV